MYYCGIVYSARVGFSLQRLDGSVLMKMAQRKIRWMAQLMLGLTLFSQAMVVAYACANIDASPAQAYSAVAIGQSGEAMPCHDAKKSNANACLGHCLQFAQINVDHSAQLVVPVTMAVLTAVVPTEQTLYASFRPGLLPPDTGPPLSIRFCSFLI